MLDILDTATNTHSLNSDTLGPMSPFIISISFDKHAISEHEIDMQLKGKALSTMQNFLSQFSIMLLLFLHVDLKPKPDVPTKMEVKSVKMTDGKQPTR